MNKEQTTNILLVGVGGQGIILASKIIARAALDRGLDVKLSEIHGMSQRGGSVVTQVRVGPEIHSPLIEKGQADYIMASELLEAWRWLPYLKEGGTVITSRQQINPMPVIIGKQPYPENLADRLQAAGAKTVLLDAYQLATQAGFAKSANIVLVGALFNAMGLSQETGQSALAQEVKAQFLPVNEKAFAAGYEREK